MKTKKIPPTLTKGVAKVPVIMQLEALECGAASLAMLMAYYGKWIPLEQVRKDCGVSRDGSKAKNIYIAAQNYGFDVKAFRKSPEDLKENGQFPCIIHWNMNHFVVLDGFRGNKVYLNDPARGNVTISWEEFDNSFTGVCIIPVPSETFKPEGKQTSTLEFAKKRLAGAGAAVAFVMITTVISYLFGIADSVTSRIFMDRLLTGLNKEWLYPFISIMILLALLQIIVSWAQTIYSLKINGKMAAVGSSSYMWKILRLPMEFYSQRLAGDIQGRLVLNSSIAETLVNTFAPLLLNSIMMIFYLVLMLRHSPLLTLIGIGTLIINIIMTNIIAKKRINIARVEMRDAGKLEAASVTGFEMIETIKASGAENGFFSKWAGYQASVNTQNTRMMKTSLLLGIIPAFFSTIANYTVLILGVYIAINGQFTLGAVLMFQGFLSSFMAPASMLISAGDTIQEMRTQMERVEDVMMYEDDPSVVDEASSDDVSLTKLKGSVELKNLTFGYSRLEPPLIKDFSLSIKPGDRIAIVGASGCGKSTLSKLGRPLPDYSESTSTYVKLFIQRAEPDLPFTRMISDEENRLGRSLPINSLLILSALQSQRRLNIQDLSKVTNISEARIKTNVEKLVESNLVEAVGNNRSRTYILSSKVYKEQENIVGYVRQKGIDVVKSEAWIMELVQKQNGRITRENVVELLNVTPSQAYRLLKKISEKGKLRLVGTGRSAYYEMVE